MKRHPSPTEIAAWFDGEGDPDVCIHILHCLQCAEAVDELARVRAAARGETVPAAVPARRPGPWVTAVVPLAAAVALLLSMAGLPGSMPFTTRAEQADTSGPRGPDGAVGPGTDGEPDAGARVAAAPVGVAAALPDARVAHAATGSGAVASADGAPTSEAPGGTRVGSGAPPRSSARPVAAGSAVTAAPPDSSPSEPRSTPVPDAIRLGVPVPTRGPLASEGDEVLRAARAVAAAANDGGGVAGRRVDIVTVPTDEDTARRVALSRVDALVGGFALDAPSGLPWLVPAEASVPSGEDGQVAAGELTAEQAGAVLGADLAGRSLDAPAGVVVAAGPDAALAVGLAAAFPVQRIDTAASSPCEDEVAGLRGDRVAALAVAGPPELARRCVEAAARQGWRPPGGVLLAPSAAYAHLELMLPAQGARTVLGFPVPSGDDAGAQRYRRLVSYSRSYRALVSFAATELALEVLRTTGEVTAGAVRSGRWTSDLYDFDHGRNLAPRRVTVRFGRWVPEP